MKAEGLEEDSKVAVGPAVKIDGGREALDEVKLEEKWEHEEFRSSGARLNYLGQDRSDIQYAVKVICQGMSAPAEGGKAKIKRVFATWRGRGGWCGSTGRRRMVMKECGWMFSWTRIGQVDGRGNPQVEG